MICPHCTKDMKLSAATHRRRATCGSIERSVKSGSFLPKSNLPVRTIVRIMQHWASRRPVADVIEDLRVASATATNWYKFCRNVYCYQGIQREVRAVLPTKKPIGGVLTADELRTNDRIASDRVIVENFFGRLKTLWSVCSDIYAWKRQNYDMLFQTCLALTNVHVRIHNLRAEDGDANTQYVNRLISIGSKIVKTKKAASRTYRSKRKV
ncbi:hypothetical protein B5M09_011329 [Aphanomyces astaci]|uniref:DDE Tnp4 domain-containing protein n=1 Tax=Aphanomyces astaci TaxID=112090 RepID=A0A3R7WW82_APHAT|nr:hypothetical protein B5M09_011329 [Aphanomyces astaci]